MSKISNVKLTQNTTGSGIIDKSIVDIIKKINDPIPYLRGLLAELGPQINLLKFNQPIRKKENQAIIFSRLLMLQYLG